MTTLESLGFDTVETPVDLDAKVPVHDYAEFQTRTAAATQALDQLFPKNDVPDPDVETAKWNIMVDVASAGIPVADIPECLARTFGTIDRVITPAEAATPGARLQLMQRLLGTPYSLELVHMYDDFSQQWQAAAQQRDPATVERFLTGDVFVQRMMDLRGMSPAAQLLQRPDIYAPWLEPLLTTYLHLIDHGDMDSDFAVFADSFLQNAARAAIQARRVAPSEEVDQDVTTAKNMHHIGEAVHSSSPGYSELYASVGALVGFGEPLTAELTEGIITSLWPAISRFDPELDILRRFGDYGYGPDAVAVFLVKAYAMRLSPAHLNELMIHYDRVLAIDAQTQIKNRIDARTLENCFGETLRKYIHEPLPRAHELVQALVTFYETGDKTPLAAFGDTVPGSWLDRGRYDKPVPEFVIDDDTTEACRGTITPIDVLRRLAANTTPIKRDPPETPDWHLNDPLKRLHQAAPQEKRQVIAQVLRDINDDLAAKMEAGTIGVAPSHVAAYAWLQRDILTFLQPGGVQQLKDAAIKLSSIGFEEQVRLARLPWFQEVLRFHELVESGNNFDAASFESFVTEIAAQPPAEALRLIAGHAQHNLASLVAIYEQRDKQLKREPYTSALMANTVGSKLLGLVQPRSGRTAVEDRLRKLYERQGPEPIAGIQARETDSGENATTIDPEAALAGLAKWRHAVDAQRAARNAGRSGD